jgi:hypothetical protein
MLPTDWMAVAKKFVVEAVVEKRLVEVEFVVVAKEVVAFVAVRFVIWTKEGREIVQVRLVERSWAPAEEVICPAVPAMVMVVAVGV